jgi:hypothetical protein
MFLVSGERRSHTKAALHWFGWQRKGLYSQRCLLKYALGTQVSLPLQFSAYSVRNFDIERALYDVGISGRDMLWDDTHFAALHIESVFFGAFDFTSGFYAYNPDARFVFAPSMAAFT